ncbi:MAG: single-stranded-DNA-specific exonuclease RecJ [Candidatus Binatia bacterium]
MSRGWTWRRPEGEPPRELSDAAAAQASGHAALVARLLWNRGVERGGDAADFLRPTLAQGLRPPTLMHDLSRAAGRLADAVGRHERVAVYGDYDVDGVTGAAQLLLALRELGAEPLLHVAHREREGYGLNADVLRRLRAEGARVVVTADLGTSNVAELALAEELGLDVIVCDHHHAPDVRPPAWALLNPLQPGCEFPFKGLSGAGVVFYLLMGLRMELRARGHVVLPELRRYLDLVALGTVADVVPLREENRVLVAHGLREIDRTMRPGLQALKESALVDRASVRAIGFRLGPRLNAGGRLADARIAVEALTTADVDRARALVAELEMHNAERRTIEDRMVREAVAQVESGGEPGAAIVAASETFHHGVVGIVAARLAERFHRPSLVVALEGEKGRGSGRTVDGLHLLEHLRACADLLEGFGGHRQAVGFRMHPSSVDALRRRFEESVAAAGTPTSARPPIEVDAEVSLAQVTPAFARALALLEPHGPGNPEPRLLARGVRVDGVRLVGDPSAPHLKLRLREGGRTLPAIAFRMGGLPVRSGDRLDVVFTPRLGSWQGVERTEVEVVGLWPEVPLDSRQGPDNSGESAILDRPGRA